MTGGFWRKNGLSRGVRVLLTTHGTWFWRAARRVPKINSRVNRLLINSSIYTMAARPPALSTKSDYTSWDSLNDREYSARHLRADDGFAPDTGPDNGFVAALFERPAGSEQRSERSSLLFPLFAQWFVDGFLRTAPGDARKNTSTHDIDLSQLYGQTRSQTCALRADDGLLKTSVTEGREFPPLYYGPDGEPVASFEPLPIVLTSNDPKAKATTELPAELKGRLFALGLPRGNMHYGLTMMSTLFLREHNRIARLIKRHHPDWDSDRIFETTRNTLIVVLIKVVIEDYIDHITPIKFPLFVEPGIGVNQRWYRQNWMSVEFNLLYRWHSLVPSVVQLGGRQRRFAELHWDTRPVTEHGLAALFDEASRQPCGTIDLLNTDTSLLHVERISMEVGRVTQLASFNAYRRRCGLPALRSIDDMTSKQPVRDALRASYGSVDDIEFFPGLFAEEVRKGSTLPPLMTTMVAVDAFSQALTNPLLAPGVYGAETFSAQGLDVIDQTRSLSDIVLRNTSGESVRPRVSLGWP